MNLNEFLNKVVQVNDGSRSIIFSKHSYDYSGNPVINIHGSVSIDDCLKDIKAFTLSFDLDKSDCSFCEGFNIDGKLEINTEQLIGLYSHEYINQIAVKIQEFIINKILDDQSIPLELSDIEEQILIEWDKSQLLPEPEQIKDNWNVIWFGYWSALKVKESLNIWKEHLKDKI